MKKKYLHEYTLKQLLVEQNEVLEENYTDDLLAHMDNMYQELHPEDKDFVSYDEYKRQKIENAIEETPVDPNDPTVGEIQQILLELEPDGWSDALVRPYIIKRRDISYTDLADDLEAIAWLHAFAQKIEAQIKIATGFIGTLMQHKVAIVMISMLIYWVMGVTATSLSVLGIVLMVIHSIVAALTVGPVAADSGDSLMTDFSFDSMAEGSYSAIVRYLPLSKETEGILSPAFFLRIIDHLRKEAKENPKDSHFDSVHHFQNWVIKVVCKDDPTAVLGACGDAMDGPGTAYDLFVDWSKMKSDLEEIYPLLDKRVLKLGATRWFANVKKVIQMLSKTKEE